MSGLFQRAINSYATKVHSSDGKKVSPYNAGIFLYKPWRLKGFIQFEIILNVLVSYIRSIWIPMLWVYDHYIFFFVIPL